MDNSFGPFGFPGNFSLNAVGNLSKIQGGAYYCADTTLRLDSPGAYSSNIKGTKRKWSAINGSVGPKDVSSLVLGLGRSPSLSDNSKLSSATVCTMSSAKETDEESSMGLDLNFQLHLGSDSAPSPKKPAVTAPKASEMEPICDLQLSLSMGSPLSVITITVPVSTQQQNSLEASVTIGAMPPVDDGSTSSRWKPGGSLLPPFYPSEPNAVIVKQMSPNKVHPVVAIPELLSTTAIAQKRSVTCTSGLTEQRNISTKTCQFTGCGKGARGASGLCIAHGGGRRCQREGCHKGAEGRTVYCKAHGGGRRCQFLGCTKSAEGRTDYCIAHGGGRRCSHKGCTRAARGRSGLCIRHGGGKRCQKENCTKSAEGYSGLCISHGGGWRCQFPACSKGAQGSTMLCKAHGGGKRCTALDCNKGAEGSTPFCKGHGGGKRCSFQGGGVCPKSVHGGTRFCVAHGGGKRCAIRECTKSARGRTDFCVRHGGGKRCKFEGCGKSAQGRTDFCKAHGGGKQCSWGRAGSDDIGTRGLPCDRFARGKTGLCAAHTALVQDRRVHGGGKVGPAASQDTKPSKPEKMKELALRDDSFAMMGNDGKSFNGWNVFNPSFMRSVIPPQSSLVSLPEGRVHGGSLMAMLASGEGSHTGYQATCNNPSEQGAEYMMPLKWM